MQQINQRVGCKAGITLSYVNISHCSGRVGANSDIKRARSQSCQLVKIFGRSRAGQCISTTSVTSQSSSTFAHLTAQHSSCTDQKVSNRRFLNYHNYQGAIRSASGLKTMRKNIITSVVSSYAMRSAASLCRSKALSPFGKCEVVTVNVYSS